MNSAQTGEWEEVARLLKDASEVMLALKSELKRECLRRCYSTGRTSRIYRFCGSFIYDSRQSRRFNSENPIHEAEAVVLVRRVEC